MDLPFPEGLFCTSYQFPIGSYTLKSTYVFLKKIKTAKRKRRKMTVCETVHSASEGDSCFQFVRPSDAIWAIADFKESFQTPSTLSGVKIRRSAIMISSSLVRSVVCRVTLTERSGRYDSTTDNKEMAGEGVGLHLEWGILWRTPCTL